MPRSDGQNKSDRHYQLQKLFSNPSQRLRTREIATKLGVNEDTIIRDISELGDSGRLPLRKDGHFWILAEDARLETLHVRLTYTEATALYLAGRLLSQAQDERNKHVILALTKLVDAMPKTLAPHQHALIDMAQQQQQEQVDRSHIFDMLAQAWTKQRKVQLTYTPPRRKTFKTLFSPYLLEPSAIGKTMYAIGYSSLPNAQRTYKMERIDHAELTNESFTIPADFDGPALLARAWGIMYGDEELIEVRLRFSPYVTKRVKETLWHPSQQILDTSDGCEWTAQIGDTLEIENWIRGWGSDCEVLAPQALREKLIKDARRLAHIYGIAAPKPNQFDEPDIDLLSSIFGG